MKGPAFGPKIRNDKKKPLLVSQVENVKLGYGCY